MSGLVGLKNKTIPVHYSEFLAFEILQVKYKKTKFINKKKKKKKKKIKQNFNPYHPAYVEIITHFNLFW